jgi:DNA polymerase-3 subunit delta
MSVHLVKGADPILRDDATEQLVGELLAGQDRSLAVEEFTIPGRVATEAEEGGAEARLAAVDAVLNAVFTLPFMTERRVVVVREVGNLTKDEAAPLVAYFQDPTPSTELVLVAGGGTIAKSLDDAVKQTGSVHAPSSEKAVDVLSSELDAAGLHLRADAAAAIVAHVGGDAGLLPSIVETLAAAFGAGADLSLDDVTPYVGSEGKIPTWDLTNALENGDIPGSLEVLRRLLTVTSPTQPKPMHPLQVLAMLHGHYRRLLRLDDPAITSNEQAAAALGGRTNPRSAGFRLRQARTLGTDGLRQAFDHLARADVDLKGGRAIPPEAVMEVLVARLAQITARAGGGRAGSGRGGGGRAGGRSGRGRAASARGR